MTDRAAKLQGSSGASTAPETFVQGGAGTSGLSDFSALTTFIFPRRVRLRVGMGKGEGKSLLQVVPPSFCRQLSALCNCGFVTEGKKQTL